MRKTKIIATLGPATESREMIARLAQAGADVFRVNMSHADHAWVRRVVRSIRSVSKETGRPLGVLMDTQGPEIRTGDLDANLELKAGETLDFTVRGEKSEEVCSVDVNYEGLVNDISVGDIVLVDNGVIRFEVLQKTNNRIRCKVLTPGTLKSRRHINLPGVKVNLPPLTRKDREDVKLGAEVGVDMIALSFCRHRNDIFELREFLQENGSSARVVPKIEDQMAVRHLDDIIRASDGIMIARGDLGIECPMEELPIIQRRMIKTAIRFNKPVVVATHMLESMITNPVPTRAEITDVANAVYEQADAIMLSGETAMGGYPVECVEVLDRVARRIERSGGAGYAADARLDIRSQKTVKSAIVLANSLTNARLIVFTRRGFMGNYTSNLRPERAVIYAFTPSEETQRKLTLNWGVHPILMPMGEHPGATVDAAESLLVKNGLVQKGDHLVIVSDVLSGDYLYDSIQLRVVE